MFIWAPRISKAIKSASNSVGFHYVFTWGKISPLAKPALLVLLSQTLSNSDKWLSWLCNLLLLYYQSLLTKLWNKNRQKIEYSCRTVCLMWELKIQILGFCIQYSGFVSALLGWPALPIAYVWKISSPTRRDLTLSIVRSRLVRLYGWSYSHAGKYISKRDLVQERGIVFM